MNFIFHEFHGWNFVLLRWFLIHIVHNNGCKENMKCELKTFQFAFNMLEFNFEGSLNFERVWFFCGTFSRHEKIQTIDNL
jgi:hypothetical protein